MARKCAMLLVALSALVAVSPASAAQRFRPRIGGALGLVPPQGHADIATAGQTPVLYHGGTVMTGGVTVHAIYWAPAGYAFSAGYKGLINQFLSDVAHDSGTSGNVFSVLPQFAQGTAVGQITAGSYTLTTDSSDDPQPYPSSGQCASPHGIPTCLTDGQVQAEVDRFINASGGTLHRGLHDIYYVFLPPNVDECITRGACGTNAFGGYHSVSDLGAGPTIYAVTPDPVIETTVPPGGDPQGNPDAEAAIDVAGHETVEAMTDPEGVGWMDPNGFEVADKCEFGPQHGTPLGYAPNGSPYNQVIDGHEYWLQEMWSNADGGCVQSTTQAASNLPLPIVSLTQFSPRVTGSIGANTAGVGVRVTVERLAPGPTPVPVAQGSASTDSHGVWALSLGRHAAGDDRDVIVVDYSGAGAPSPARQVILTGNGGNPFAEAGWTGWTAMDQGAALTAGGNTLTLGPCFQTGVLAVEMASRVPPPSPTDFCNTQTDTATVSLPVAAGRAQPVSYSSLDNRAYDDVNGAFPNPNGGLVALTVPVGEPDAVSPFASPLASFTPTGQPSCSADLQAQSVTCVGLIANAAYTVSDGSRSIPVSATTGGNLSVPLPVRQGDAVTLSNGSRTLTTLHVAHLRVDLLGNQTTVSGGSCEPGQYLSPPLSTAPLSPAAGVDPGTPDGGAFSGVVCPLNGDASGLTTSELTQTDDGSGGFTQTEVPQILDTSPAAGTTMYGPFIAFVDAGLPNPDGSFQSSSAAVSLTVQNRTGRTVFRAANVNTSRGVTVPALATGIYTATWKLTDASGDTRTSTSRFVAEPAKAPAAKPTKPRRRCVHLSHHRLRCTSSHKKKKK